MKDKTDKNWHFQAPSRIFNDFLDVRTMFYSNILDFLLSWDAISVEDEATGRY